jgi:hypothetical protein
MSLSAMKVQWKNDTYIGRGLAASNGGRESFAYDYFL